MSTYDDEASVDPYELVEQHWPYDGPYSDELTGSAAFMIARFGRYLNNATQKRDGLPYLAVVGRVLAELHAAVAGYEQLFTQLARFADHQAVTNPSVYDDRRDRPGADTAHALAAELRADTTDVRGLAQRLAEAARLAYHLGSD